MVTFVLALALGGCGEEDPLLPVRGALAGPRRQVVLITIDTLRTERLGAYGNSRPTSPFIDQLARGGVQFMRAYAPAPVTVASHMSLLTGLAPHTHGAIRNIGRITRDGVPSLPAFLRQRGYDTAAFLSVPFLHPRDKHLPGFAHVELPPVGEQWSARETFRRAAAWVRAHADEAFFVWLHAYDPHKPYDPPAPYDTAFWDEAPEPYELSRSGFLRDGEPTRRQKAYLSALYDGEVRATDAAVEEFFDAVGPVWPEPPLVIVTADHGEVLAEQAADVRMLYFHGKYPYNQALSVPLVVHWRNRLTPARQWSPVDITGLAPTIAGLLFDDPYDAEVASFADLVRGHGTASEPLFAFAPRADTIEKIPPGWEFRGVETWSILRWPWHLVHNPLRATSLYDVEADPLELHDRAAEEPERTARLRAEAIAHFSGLARPVEDLRPVDEKLQKQLESLGYVDEP